MIDIVSLGNKLWCDTLGYNVEELETFTFLRSAFFNDSSYNYIIPKVANTDLNWSASDAIIQEQLLNNWHVSYYIRQSEIKSEYDRVLKEKGYEKADEESYLFAAQQKGSCKNYFAKHEGKITGIGGVLYSKELNLGYLTNACTLPEFRGKGIQQRMIQKRCGELYRMGITRVFSIAEPGCISYHNLVKREFEDVDRYALYAKVVKQQ